MAVFYGWMIVAVATLSIVCSVPGQTAGVGVFTNHIIDTLGMTRDELSLAYMVGTLTSGFILPFSGRLLDIIGVRLMSLCVSVGLAVSLLILSQVDRLAEMLKAFFSFRFGRDSRHRNAGRGAVPIFPLRPVGWRSCGIGVFADSFLRPGQYDHRRPGGDGTLV